MFMGEYHHNIDEKNRIIIPSKYRKELGDSFIITRGLDKCLFIYSTSEFEKNIANLESLPFTKKDSRTFMRFFLSGASSVEFDKQGRIIIPSSLINYAELEKECIIVGVGERLEVWSHSLWEEFYNSTNLNMSEIAEELFDTIIK